MFRKFYPNEYVNSTYEIDFNKLYESGIRGLIFDIDNTLVNMEYLLIRGQLNCLTD